MPRKKILLEGIVQGVGFRPFVYQLARRFDLGGWVLNNSCGVQIEVEGGADAVSGFCDALRTELPPLASISRYECHDISLAGEQNFVIRQSETLAEQTAQIAPDTYVCPDCLTELFHPGDRRYRYPFINCTNCGPRYTIIKGVPYDRSKTTMASFPMCSQCQEEYDAPTSRRFHAQPNACPVCGPQLTLLDGTGHIMSEGDEILQAVKLLRSGAIMAIKGLGGYHLAVDAANNRAVSELRRRKVRDEKPFAVMSFSAKQVASYAEVDEAERRLLESVERPIVLLKKKSESVLSPLVAPRNRYVGVMLPYTPLHYLLLKEHFSALVMTSGNQSDEPIAFEDGEARSRLNAIADYFLTHNRDIHIRTDDSIARVMAGRPLVVRRSRGYVPRGVSLPQMQPPVLAVGAELKNTVCLTQQGRAYLSHYVGDLKNPKVLESFEQTIDHLKDILGVQPNILAHDLHPDYDSTRYAENVEGMTRVGVQHHHAHLASCLAENGTSQEAIGIIFDGIGYGSDGHIWGGEFLVGNYEGFRREGHFDYVGMPGGDAATREPYRMALSWLVKAFGDDLPSLPVVNQIPENDRKLLLTMIRRGINSPLTSSCGRLFDAVAALVGLRSTVSYEGQAALELEMAIDPNEKNGVYPVVLDESPLIVFKPSEMIRAMVHDLQGEETVARISARFHNTLAQMVRQVCVRLRSRTGLETVALSGGVFQNRYLTEKTVMHLTAEGFQVLTHSLVPPNDGGLALGQAVIAGARSVSK